MNILSGLDYVLRIKFLDIGLCRIWTWNAGDDRGLDIFELCYLSDPPLSLLTSHIACFFTCLSSTDV